MFCIHTYHYVPHHPFTKVSLCMKWITPRRWMRPKWACYCHRPPICPASLSPGGAPHGDAREKTGYQLWSAPRSLAWWSYHAQPCGGLDCRAEHMSYSHLDAHLTTGNGRRNAPGLVVNLGSLFPPPKCGAWLPVWRALSPDPSSHVGRIAYLSAPDQGVPYLPGQGLA
jgi:hypothetical protein